MIWIAAGRIAAKVVDNQAGWYLPARQLVGHAVRLEDPPAAIPYPAVSLRIRRSTPE
jgi:hypothetical protein